MPALRSEANITSDVWLCSAQPPWGMRPYGYLVSSCMPGHCLNCEKVASATQSQYGSTRDKCWDVSLNILVLCCLQGRSWLGHRLMVTLELLSEHPLQTDLGLSFPNGRKGLRVLDGYLPEKRSFLSHFRMRASKLLRSGKYRNKRSSLSHFRMAGRGHAFWKVTWLILPVVICLSQRLSHACLSVNNSYETANGSLNQLSNT